jgi:hypothetical protein
MKKITGILATVALVGAIAVAHAQGTSVPNQTGTDQNQGVERNPNGTTGGSMNNPSVEGRDGMVRGRNEGEMGNTTGSGANQTSPAYPDAAVRSGSTPGR